MKRWAVTVAVALNQLLNALTGGHADESVSSRLGHAREHGSRFARVACATLQKINPGDPDHCAEAEATHRARTRRALEREP